jgi:hypothetical protein
MSYKQPKLAGDVTGDPISNTVASIQGVVISGTPSANQILTATSSTAAHWVAGGGADIFSMNLTTDVNINTADPTFVNLGSSLTVTGTSFLIQAEAVGLSNASTSMTPRLQVIVDGVAQNYLTVYGNTATVSGAGVQTTMIATISGLSAGSHIFQLQGSYGGSTGWTVHANTNPTRESAWLVITPIGSTAGNKSLSGTAVNRPTSTGSGISYYCTDIPVLYFDNPTTSLWQQFATEYMPAPVAASNYTVAGPSTANLSLTQWADTIRVTSISNSGVGCVAVAANSNLGASQSWGVTLVATFNPFQNASNGSEFGIALTNGTTSGTSTGRVFDFIHGITGSTTNIGFEIDSFTIGIGRSGSGITSSLGYPLFIGGTGRIHMRALADGVNLHYQISTDGFHWMDVYSEATPSGFTNYGFMLGYNNTGANSGSYAQALVYENNIITPTQYTITNNTAANPSIVTIGTHTIQAGDVVSIHGATTNLNSGTGSGSLVGGWIVTAVASTTITVATTSAPAAGSAGTVTLISR